MTASKHCNLSQEILSREVVCVIQRDTSRRPTKIEKGNQSSVFSVAAGLVGYATRSPDQCICSSATPHHFLVIVRSCSWKQPTIGLRPTGSRRKRSKVPTTARSSPLPACLFPWQRRRSPRKECVDLYLQILVEAVEAPRSLR